jgi:hypothetical protein
VALAASAAAAALAACTFILPFDEIDPDGGGLDARVPDRADPEDTFVPDSGGPDVKVVDAARDVDLDALASCAGKTGTFCGNNQLDAYPFPDDLVVCDAGKVVKATPCTTGTKCIHLQNPHPDQCDECASKADGYYCGRDFSGWIKTGTDNNANIRVHCRSGGQDRIDYCQTTCTESTPGTAICNP